MTFQFINKRPDFLLSRSLYGSVVFAQNGLLLFSGDDLFFTSDYIVAAATFMGRGPKSAAVAPFKLLQGCGLLQEIIVTLGGREKVTYVIRSFYGMGILV